MNKKTPMELISAMATYDELQNVGTREAYFQIKKKYGIDIVDILIKHNELKLRIASLENSVMQYEDLVAEILQNKK